MPRRPTPRDVLLAECPYCIFCGGTEPATTIEHCPPRALFDHKQWPEGFDFASCEACNAGSKNLDVVVAALRRFDPTHSEIDGDGRLMGLLRNARQQHPEFIEQMVSLSPVDARKAARRLGLARPPGMTFQEIGIVRVTPEMDKAVYSLAAKLSRALYFKQLGLIFPKDGVVLASWFTNAEKIESGQVKILNTVAPLMAQVLEIQRSSKSLSEQFECRVGFSDDNRLGVISAVFGFVFGFVSFLDADNEKCMRNLRELEKATGKPCPLTLC